MSYKSTLRKLLNTCSVVESSISDVLIEVDVYKELHKKCLVDMNNLLKKLDVDSWHFYTINPRWYIYVKHNDDDVMKAWSRQNPTDVRIPLPIPTRGQFNFKDEIDHALLEIIRASRLNLPLFLNKGVKSIKLIESLATEELGKDLLSTYAELYQAFEDITKIAPLGDKLLPKDYSKSLTNLEQQAANEWFAEGYVKKGMNLKLLLSSIGYPYHSEEIIGIVDSTVVTTEKEYPELLRLNSQSPIPYTDYDEIRKATWRTYNSNIDVDKILNLETYVDNFEKKYIK